MKHLLITAISIVCGLSAMAQSQRYELTVGDFTSLNVLDNINVVYESDNKLAGTVVFETTQEMADGLIFNNNTHGKMTIQVSTEVLNRKDLPTLHIYSTLLSMAENAGDSTLTLRNVKPLNTLKTMLSDNGRINVENIDVKQLELLLITGKGVIQASGQCEKMVAKVLGKGSIDALEVTAQKIQCGMMGTGIIDCTAQGSELSVRGSGTGRVNYLGQPSKITVRKLGPLKVTRMD